LLRSAARLIVRDAMAVRPALERAAQEVGLNLRHCRLDCEQISRAVHDYRSLFHPESEAQWRAARETALAAMRELDAFHPRLAGHLVDGLGTPDRILLLVDADTPEEIARELIDRRIPWHACEHRLLHAKGRYIDHPSLCFEAGTYGVEIIVLKPALRSDPPRDALCDRPMPLLTTRQLETLLD
jgi:hypothetical protein